MRTTTSGFLGMTLAAAFVLGHAQQAGAAPIILLNYRDSTAVIDPEARGLYNWRVDGVNQLYEQWFWYRIGGGGPEFRVETLGLSSWTSTANTAQLTFGGPGSLEVSIGYTLFGWGWASWSTSSIAESVAITNRTGRAIDLSFFEYADFDLNGTSRNSRVRLTSSKSVIQLHWEGVLASYTEVTPTPRGVELAFYPSTRESLNDAFTTNLPDVARAMPLGPGDLTWAFQWDVTVPPECSFLINTDTSLTPEPISWTTGAPEPASLLLFGTGLVGVWTALRRQLRP